MKRYRLRFVNIGLDQVRLVLFVVVIIPHLVQFVMSFEINNEQN